MRQSTAQERFTASLRGLHSVNKGRCPSMFAQACVSPCLTRVHLEMNSPEPIHWNLTFERERVLTCDIDMRKDTGVRVGGSSKDGLGLISKSRDWLPGFAFSIFDFSLCLSVRFGGHPSLVGLSFMTSKQSWFSLRVRACSESVDREKQGERERELTNWTSLLA